ncbi:hypothetical protein GGR54DRAFT_635939 [Hypoxylon sp. NC1633]|nr:hypothetical protein GGR54DRAFT_635939 [Hypoxylon sp. NC1633]
MVGFVGRFRKPKLPVALGSPREDDLIPPQMPATPQRFTPPVLRNFSYPTNVGNQQQIPPYPSAPNSEQTTWDQLGEICNFSPNSVSRTGKTRTAGLEDPFFFGAETEPYSRLDDNDDQSEGFCIGISSDQICDQESPSREEPKARKKQRRTSFDTSRLVVLPSGSPDRPASSSGIPLIDTRSRPSSPAARVNPSPPSLSGGSTGINTTGIREVVSVSQTAGAFKYLEMGPSHYRDTSSSYSGQNGSELEGNEEMRRNNSTSESTEHKKKDAKGGWLSHLKDWASVSEPSAQALRQYKKDTYGKAHIALDDPQASAKLHFPIGTLPQDAIKPAGRGPDPEKMGSKAEKRKKTPQTQTQTKPRGTSRGSRSSRYSSSSSVALNATKGDVLH